MKRFQLATWATLAGVTLAAGCASPCGCGGGLWQRFSMFRPHGACPCDSGCGCGGGGVAITGEGPVLGDGGPFLGEAPGALVSQGPGGLPIGSPVGPPIGPPLGQSGGPPATLPPNLGAPFGTPSVPAPDGRLTPIPNAAQPVPAEGSSRKRQR